MQKSEISGIDTGPSRTLPKFLRSPDSVT